MTAASHGVEASERAERRGHKTSLPEHHKDRWVDHVLLRNFRVPTKKKKQRL